MRRHIKRIADITRVTGIVLICLALVFSVYVAASIHGPWSEFSGALNQRGVQTNFADRLRFDGAYYGALSQIASEKGIEDETRAAHARPYFASFEERAVAAEKGAASARLAASWEELDADFDLAAFQEIYEQAEDTADARELREIFEYLDGLAPAPAKGKAARLKAASVEPWFRENYAAFAQEQGEEGGTYLEYMLSVQRLIQRDIEAGNTVKDVKGWMADRFDGEAYAAVLEEVRAEERTASHSLTDQFAESVNAGRSVSEAFTEVFKTLKAEDDGLDEMAFVDSFRALLMDSSFDGSVKSLRESMNRAVQAGDAASFKAFMDDWTARLVAEADNRSAVRVVALFWRVVSWFVALAIIGAALVLIGVLMSRLLARYMLKKMDRVGIDEKEDVLLRVEHLCQYFRSGDHVTKAVNDVSFFVRKGEVFGLVGESGCGKTTTGRTIINLYDPTSGDVYFDGLRISSGKNGLPVLSYTLRRDAKARIAELKDGLKEKLRQNPQNAQALKDECDQAIREVRKGLRDRLVKAQNDALEAEAEKNKAVQLYRQQRREQLTRQYEEESAKLSGQAKEDRKRRWEVEMKAAASDNVMTRMQMIFQDPIASIDPRMTVREIIAEGLRIRGIKDKAIIDQTVYEMLDLVGLVSEHADRYPHEFSGGQRQRIGIARAIALEPELIIADEPISALDVSIQAQVINLLNDLRKRMGLTIIFIAHNLSVVKYFSDRIAVMYFGNIVEMTTSEELFEHPLHPYTRSLLSAIPYPDPHYEKQRKRVEYNPVRAHDYSVDKPSLREIRPGHWIHCNDAEFAAYRKELGL